MSHESYRVSGRVIDRSTGAGVPGVRVEAWDRDPIRDDLLGSAMTGADGAFSIRFDRARFGVPFPEHHPDIYFKLYRGAQLLHDTGGSVLCNLREPTRRVTIALDLSTLGPPEGLPETGAYAVSGRVSLAGGWPAAGVQVRAVDRDLRSEEPLGQAVTDADGAYRIEYAADRFGGRERGGADLVVRALADDGSVLAASPVLFQAPAQAAIDLSIPAGRRPPPSLLFRIATALEPLLGGLPAAELEEDADHQDLSFLAGETGFEAPDLARFAVAHRLARRGIEVEFWFALLVPSVLRWDGRRSVGEALAAVEASLPSLDEPAVRRALARSFAAGDVDPAPPQRVDAWVQAFLAFAARQAVAAGEEPSFLRQALEHAGVKTPEGQEAVALRFNRHGGALTPALLAELQADPTVGREVVADLSASYRLAELTRGDFSVVGMLKDEFDIRRPEQVRALARLDEGEWVDLVERKHSAGEIELPLHLETEAPGDVRPPEARTYAVMLDRRFREAFPTAAFAGGLQRALNNGGTRGIAHAPQLHALLESHPELDLRRTVIDEPVAGGNPKLGAAAADPAVVAELKAVQRVYKFAPTFEATDTLRADGIHSAQQAYRMGETEFVRRYAARPGFDEDQARLAWNRAADTHAAVLTVVGDLQALHDDALPAVLQGNGAAPRAATAGVRAFPSWNDLFRGGDVCHCEACRSVLSPAAYFADLLLFLRDRDSDTTDLTARDVLLARRPDLGWLELGCENANTPLPYVDVVCEVLERVVADGRNDVRLTGFTSVPPGAGAGRAAVAAALAAAGVDVGAEFTLVQVNRSSPDRWVVHGERAVWLLKKKPAETDFFAELLPNTRAPADELRAYPAYVNPRAYEALREARFPWILPFDLFAEEVRAAFRRCGVQRWELMRTLRGTRAPNNPSDGDIAAEYLGISSAPGTPVDEKRLIVDALDTDAGQREVWGETAAGWMDRVANVRTFLRKTGLEYEELLALLDLPFANPGGGIAVDHRDASCDLDQKALTGLDAARLDRIHRFLRLWRKLDGWAMWELDLALRTPGIGLEEGGAWVLKEPVLVNLHHLGRLRARLGAKTSVQELCGLFADLETRTRFTRPHEPRADGFYASLFLNRRMVQPLDPALAVAAVTAAAPTEQVAGHRPAIVAALGIGEPDLVLLEGLTPPSGGAPYVTGPLSLANLSFLWRHAWLSRRLGLRPAEWKTVLKLLREDVPRFASPLAAVELVAKVDVLKASGFTPDELDWLLAASRSARAAPAEADAARFLAALRTDLRALRAEYDPARYPFLSPPSDAEALSALLLSLLPQLHRDEAGARFAVDALRGEAVQAAVVPGLPASFAFPGTITGAPNRIAIAYEPVLVLAGALTDAQKSVLLGPSVPDPVRTLPAYRAAVERLFANPGRPAPAPGLPPGFQFPEPVTGAPNHVPIRYEPVLRFTGVMTAAQRDALLGTSLPPEVAGNAGYRAAVEGFFSRTWLALRFLDPVFTAPLATLPAAADFGGLERALAQRVSYDAGERVLRVAGILSAEERRALDGLSGDAAYRAAVDSLFTQPRTGTFPADAIWLDEAALRFPLRDPATLAANLAAGVRRALAYLSRTRGEALVVQRAAAQTGLDEPIARRLLTRYARLPATLLEHLAGPFAAGSGTVDRATLPDTFNGWEWALRVATLWKKWKPTPVEWERMHALTAAAQLLDPLSLPLADTAAPAPADRFLRTVRLERVREGLPEAGTTLPEVLLKLAGGGYAEADFAADVERLEPRWSRADAAALVAALKLELAYPGGYLLAESWERVRRAFELARGLNAGMAEAARFAAPAMGGDRAAALKPLLRARFGAEGWLAMSAEIQDVLRERKRDALAAWLLARPARPGAPTGGWENANDLYAYYLLDVEMGACQLTSRLVQGAGSIQLFVQRCFMGLEPRVRVRADGPEGDSAWRWWAWMRKYRVWEANRKVFLWPENWIEPELRRDRSPFFRDLENELLQNEIDAFSVETAFAGYLEKLDGVAQLEVAGFYQEDDGDEAVLHVFGRTPGAEPHLYWYRRFDYRQWSPWEKVELDIQGDYLVPVVLNRRLFLFWPVFTEEPERGGNTSMKVPPAASPSFTPTPTSKQLKLEMAMSEYRQGRWTPRRVSRDAVRSFSYTGEIHRKHYTFFPVDRTPWGGGFAVAYAGHSTDVRGFGCAYLPGGSFQLSGCRGVPELGPDAGAFEHAIRPTHDISEAEPVFLKWVERSNRRDPGTNDLTFDNLWPVAQALRYTPVLQQTPWLFRISPPWHLSYLDRLLDEGLRSLGLQGFGNRLFAGFRGSRDYPVPAGSWLPFFYADQQRTFFVVPTLREEADDGTVIRHAYPSIKRRFRQLDELFDGAVRAWVSGLNLGVWDPQQRAAMEQYLAAEFPDAPPPPPTDQTARDLWVRDLYARLVMRYLRLFLGQVARGLFQFRQFHFRGFYHPFVCDFARLVHDPLQGVPGLMRRETQLKDSGFRFAGAYQPTVWVVEPGTENDYPREVVDFSPDGAYASYNWELFYHVPLLIGNALSRNQRFQEARDWYHFIFNPVGVESTATGGSPMSKFWITRPFFETTGPQYVQQRIENLLRILAGDITAPGYSAALATALEAQVGDWRSHPFEPHRIASYRTVAYQKTVVMKYLDNLVAWGDYLFRQDSMESISEATQLYILAAEILGPRPRRVPPRARPPLETFHELEGNRLDAFANAVVQMENLVPPQTGTGTGSGTAAPLPMLYFCIPPNEKMLGYWDTVADRLYKIRHCMNIEGVVRQLALFEPAIDPGALVKAVAGGADPGAAVADLAAPLPLYRFSVLLQKANEVCGDVRALGAALLAALEKKDAEALALLRQRQEIRVHESVKSVREQQVAEAKEQLAALRRTEELVTLRRDYYRQVTRVNASEQLQLQKLEEALGQQQAAQAFSILASVASIVPSFDVGASGFGGTPKATVMFGGSNVASGLQAIAGMFTFAASEKTHAANRASINAGHGRRWDDWKLQEKLADKELEQNARQIAAADLRVKVAERELQNQALQIENANATYQHMRSKYTSEELYQWQVGQVSGVYFQSYRLAYDLARRAERCFRFELGVQDSGFIGFGYWDSLRKGLLAGERLQYDLRRLETAYLEQNRREFELTKHVSVALLDPLALVKLRETGRCFFTLPEESFDLDYPGHYFRRIRSVSLTLPCVAGPYTTVSCTLRLLGSSIRVNTAQGDNGYPRNTDPQGLPADDPRFVETQVPVRAIASSGGQNDSGVFELSFRDERYLPFEGAGAVSRWALELFSDPPANNPDPTHPDFGRPLRQFDYGTITDAVLHVKYTAREDAGPFKNRAVAHLREHLGSAEPAPSLLMLNLRRDFSAEWSRFLSPTPPADGNVLEVEMAPNLFPFRDSGQALTVRAVWLLARCASEGDYGATLAPPLAAPPTPPAPDPNALSLKRLDVFGGLHVGTRPLPPGTVRIDPDTPPARWRVRMTRPGGGNLAIDPVTRKMEVEDLLLVLEYGWA